MPPPSFTPCTACALFLLQRYDEVQAAKLGLRAYDREVAGGLLRLMYEDAGG